MPITRYFQILVGMAGIQPSEFWNLSPHETYEAIEGFMEFNASSKEEPLDKDELQDLMELYPD